MAQVREWEKIDERLMKRPIRPKCLDKDKADYEVKELETGYTCVDGYAEAVDSRLAALQKTIRNREAEMGKKK